MGKIILIYTTCKNIHILELHQGQQDQLHNLNLFNLFMYLEYFFIITLSFVTYFKLYFIHINVYNNMLFIPYVSLHIMLFTNHPI
jgi:hypothetical protein